jgi:hypothetical protein
LKTAHRGARRAGYYHLFRHLLSPAFRLNTDW